MVFTRVLSVKPPYPLYINLFAYITDTEGTKFFFDTLKKSKIVSLHLDKGLQFNKTSTVPFFIFGGDATDRGPYDLTITELLVDFKKRYPG